ncbi:MAG: hypothetical protein IPP31_00110 [Chitinophagaceae bacterium]|nr:hypothetical protein [Chitinophagaceae bacterium]
MKNIIKVLLEILVGVVFLIWGKYYADDNLRPELYGMAIGAGAVLLIEFLGFIYEEWAFLGLYMNCFTYKKRPAIRLTISYLYKIELQGKYLLIKSNRLQNTFQPVGGVYKYFDPEATNELNCMSIVTDNHIPNDDVNEYDLRLKMNKRKNIRKFLKWFFSNKEREFDPWREFYEELVESQILPAAVFKYIHYDLVGQHFEPIHFDTRFNIDTFKYADIYTPKFVTDEQKEEVRKLLSVNSPEFIWATEQEILNKTTTDGKRIADHTFKIFHTKRLHE